MGRSIRDRTIRELFDELGIEELWQRNYLVNQYEYHWHREDFAPGAFLEKFMDYTVGRFEGEFCCILWFS